jgi:hypothetical protein
MKNLVLKYVSAFLTVWYCLSIIGFDVHSCAATGSVFVNSVLSGMTCDDIHPEHDCCDHGSCCDHESCCAHHDSHEEEESEEDGCCTNEIEVLDEVVVTNADEDELVQFSETLSCLFVESYYNLLVSSESNESVYKPDSGCTKIPDSQAVLNIWRI